MFDLASHGDAPALLSSAGTVTYAALARDVAAVAARLGGTRRLVQVEGGNDAATLTAYLGALAGGHAVLLTPPGEAGAALRKAYDPDAVWSGGTLTERRDGTAHDLHPDLALLLSTSGTTGSPKLVRLSYGNLRSNASSIATYLGIDAADRAATTLPMHYCYGLSVIHAHLLRGAALVLTDLSVVDPCFWRLFRERGATTFAGVPYTFELLDRVGFAEMDLPSLRYVTQAGGRLAPERVRSYAALGRARGWDLVVMYGQTEATARMAYLPPSLAEEHPDCIGVAIPGGTLSIEDGELVYDGANVMLGYASRPEDLALGRTVTRLRTGDLAERVDGLFRVTGRRSRFVKAFGLRIDLDSVESRLRARGLVAAVADAGEGLVVAAESVRDAGVLRREVAASCGLPARAVAVHAVASLPRLPGGKPDYAAVRALGASALPAAATGDLRAAYAAVLDRRGVTGDDTFVGLGGDSLSYVELSVRVEAALGHLPPAWHVTPIRDLTPAPAARRVRTLDTSVVLRAVAIVLVVASHANLVDLAGGAHALLAVAGFNYARFHLTAKPRAERTRHALRSVARLALPSMAWIAGVVALTGQYGPPNVLLLNGVLGPPTLGPTWQFWFVESLVYTVLALTALLALAYRVERRAPFWTAMAFVGLGLLTRYDVVSPLPLGREERLTTAYVVFWLFALGWAAAQAASRRHRVVVSVAALLTVPGFFTAPSRTALVLAAFAALVWVPAVPWPARLARPTAALASASLYVYLVHWQVFPHLQWRSPLLATALSLVAGIAYWRLVTTVTRLLPPLVRTAAGAVARGARRAATGAASPATS